MYCLFETIWQRTYRYWVHWKTVKATFSRLLSSKFVESFLVFLLWNSAENSPFKVNVFTKRYTVSVKWRDNRHDALLFVPLKKLSQKVTQLISFSFEKTANDFSIFWYVVIKSPCFAPFALCSGLFLQIRDKWTSDDSKD